MVSYFRWIPADNVALPISERFIDPAVVPLFLSSVQNLIVRGGRPWIAGNGRDFRGHLTIRRTGCTNVGPV